MAHKRKPTFKLNAIRELFEPVKPIELPFNRRVRSYSTPYTIQVWDNEQKEWVNIPFKRRVNYNKAVMLYFTMYDEAKDRQPNWRKRPLIRLYDHLHKKVLIDHERMVKVGNLSGWYSKRELAAMLVAAQAKGE